MRFKFSIRTLLMLPVFTFLLVRFGILVHSSGVWPPRRPYAAWILQLEDASGTVLSRQHNMNQFGPDVQPGKYVVREKFPGVLNALSNVIAQPSPCSQIVIVGVTVEDQPLAMLDNSGMAVRVFDEHGWQGVGLGPGKYSLVPITEAQIDDYYKSSPNVVGATPSDMESAKLLWDLL